MQTKRKIQIALASLLLLLIPVAVIAQGTGGKKKSKPEKEQLSKTEKKSKTEKRSKSKINADVKVSDPDDYINGHGYVDLGLPSGLKWATCNVGASLPEDYGDYFAWGETNTKPNFIENNNENINYILVDDISGNYEYDAARSNWKSSWRMPTKNEYEELMDYCNWIWTTFEGKRGYKIIGKNGKCIFLPATGFRINTSLSRDNEVGYYWCSTPTLEGAYELLIIEKGYGIDWLYRYAGIAVRPVSY